MGKVHRRKLRKPRKNLKYRTEYEVRQTLNRERTSDLSIKGRADRSTVEKDLNLHKLFNLCDWSFMI